MKAVCWEGTNDIRVERVPDPVILNPRDAIVRVTSTAICGSDHSNPEASTSETLYGFPSGALFGYSHMMGGYAGGQAEYVRVPYADVGPSKVPAHLRDEQVLFLTDIFPTGHVSPSAVTVRNAYALNE